MDLKRKIVSVITALCSFAGVILLFRKISAKADNDPFDHFDDPFFRSDENRDKRGKVSEEFSASTP